MRNKAKLHIIVDSKGVEAIQIVGTAEAHRDGHDLYFSIQDLILDLDKAIQEKVKEKIGSEETNGH